MLQQRYLLQPGSQGKGEVTQNPDVKGSLSVLYFVFGKMKGQPTQNKTELRERAKGCRLNKKNKKKLSMTKENSTRYNYYSTNKKVKEQGEKAKGFSIIVIQKPKVYNNQQPPYIKLNYHETKKKTAHQ